MTFTFIVVGDPQYYQSGAANRETETNKTIDQIKRIISGARHDVLGVLVIGDLIQTGDNGGENVKKQDFDKYKEKWNESLLGVPILEGYGNHDQTDERGLFQSLHWDQVVDFIKARNRSRTIKDVGGRTKQLTAVDTENGHYAWTWGGIHFINLNDHAGRGNFNEPDSTSDILLDAAAGIFVGDGPRAPQARASLTFLERVLRDHVTPGQTVILMHHMNFDDFSLNGDGGWWTPGEREALFEAVKHHNVVAMFAGHSHRYQHQHTNYTESDGTTVALPFDVFVADATFHANGAQGFLKVEVDTAVTPPTMRVTRHYSPDKGANWQTGSTSNVSVARAALRSPNPLWSNARGWDQPQYYETIQLANAGSNLYLLGRASDGIHTWQFDGSQWVQVASGTPGLSDASGWNGADNYSTIQTADVGGVLHLLARANRGMHIWQLNGSRWTRIASGTPEWSDASGWSDVTNYSTIQAVAVGGALHVMGRANKGMHIWRLNGSQWTRIASSTPAWSDAGGWTGVQYYSTIQAVAVGGALHLLARADNGIRTWRLDGSQWTRIASGMPAWSDASGWSGVQYYSTIQAVPVGSTLHLLARASSGIHTWRLNGSTWSQVARDSPAWSDASGWNSVGNYSTIQAVPVGSTLYLLARANSGIHTWRLNGGTWSQVARDSPAWSDANGWKKVRHYSTIQAAPHNGKLILVGRADTGIHTWWLDNRTWRRL